MSGGSHSLEVPAELYAQLEGLVKGSEFATVDDYVLFVLREVLAGEQPNDQLSPEEQRLVEERLRGLGYIE